MKGKYRKVVTIEGKRCDITARTKAELYEKIARKKIEIEQGIKKISRNMLTSDWVEEWLKTYKAPSVSPDWYDNIKKICDSIIIPGIGGLRLKDVKPVHLQRILNSKADCSRSYLRTITILMGEIFKTAAQNGLTLQNPAEMLNTPAGKKKKHRRSLTPQERKWLLAAIEGSRGELFLKFQLYCGLRPGEAAALRWGDVDTKKGVVRVDKAMKKCGEIGDTKTAAGIRSVPIPEVFRLELAERKGDPFEMIALTAKGEKLTQSSIRRLWQSVIHDMNVAAGCRTYRNALIPPYPVADDIVMYCLRHTYCTDLQAAGVPINVARELMGHSDISTTAEIYTHSSAESFESARMKIDELEAVRAAK